MKLAVTGATGYIGQRLIRAALLAGHEVLALSRSNVALTGITWQYFELDDATYFTLPNDVNVVFHLAADTQNAHGSEKSELAGAKRIIAAASSVDADFVFVSSQTAREDAPTGYGRIKWQIERLTLAVDGWVVRPGLVYGGPECGLFGELCKIVQRLPVLPAFFPSPLVQPVHVDDLVDALLVCHKRTPPSVLCIGAVKPIEFTIFLQAIARYRARRNLICIHIPVSLVRGAAKLLGARLSGKSGLDRLISLFTLPIMATARDLQQLSSTLRTLEVGLTHTIHGRRSLLLEGRAMLMYVLRLTPDVVLVKRYVKAIEKLRCNKALRLPKIFTLSPVLLGLIDRATSINDEFQNEFCWRLNAALILAEASPQGARRYLGMNDHLTGLRYIVRIITAVILEASRRAAQVMLSPILSYVGRRGVFE
jgi:nucleoside-diphosphate-sugar epimerase